MGLIQSVFCSITFCVERVLTYACCAFLMMLMMFTVIILMVYGIAVGYHYAQKELASFAVSTRSTTVPPGIIMRRAGDANGVDESQPVVRLVAVNRSEVEHAPQPELEIYQRRRPGEKIYMDASSTPIVLLHTERPPREPELSPQEKELARRLIGRFRRSRNNSATAEPFLRPLRALNVTGITSVLPLT